MPAADGPTVTVAHCYMSMSWDCMLAGEPLPRFPYLQRNRHIRMHLRCSCTTGRRLIVSPLLAAA